MSDGIEWDGKSVAQFEARMAEWRRRMGAAGSIAVGTAALALLDDARNVVPTVPKAPIPYGGTLEEAGQVRVRGDSADIVFDVPYAAPMHAGRWQTGPLAGVTVRKWSEPGSGPGFLGEKLRRFRQKYADLIAETIRKKVGM